MQLVTRRAITSAIVATFALSSVSLANERFERKRTSEPTISTRSTFDQSTTPVSFDQAFFDASARRNANEIAELTQAFINLGPEVDPAEAARAAWVVYTYVDQLVIEYQITDSPLVHNTKVNFGQKPRGLCWHWAHDIDARLMRERFRTLEIHRAIANYNNLRLEHSTTILGRRGDPMSKAIVLDPWRLGGELFWEIVEKDTRYNWTPREEVFAYKRRLKESKLENNSRKIGGNRLQD